MRRLVPRAAYLGDRDDSDYDDDAYLDEEGAAAIAGDSKRDDGDAAHAIHEQDRVVPARTVPPSVDAGRAPRARGAPDPRQAYGGPTLHACCSLRGSGATFTLGGLDELVGRVTLPLGAGGEEVRTRQVVVWCWFVRLSFFCIPACDVNAPRSSLGAINWFAPYLLQIVTRAALPGSPIKFSIRIYVTYLCTWTRCPRSRVS
ncbi:hypothetical protein DFH09DRAFT_1327294 [Mycena vulgaris]|nr:hypothetical protein DFH09DRAFT_1327294 [Mycena vulgaris]